MEKIMENNKNPFSISKAVDLTNQEIKDMWVDEINFEKFIEPLSLKPKMIIGGKGTGKTHLMRYFSYDVRLQNSDIKTLIKDDKYLCIFIQGEMLQSEKFSRENDDSESMWEDIFIYYFGLFVFNTCLLPLLEKISADYDIESQLSERIADLFDTPIFNNVTKLSNIKEQIQKEIKLINYKVNNHSFYPDGIKNIKISIDADKIFFQIPNIIKDILNDDKLVINYFIDEFENFTSKQQKYIQTLIRDSRTNCTFRLGIRSYAYNSDMLRTKKNGEPNKIGSEIEEVILDDWLIENDDKYENFIVKIIQKKIGNTDNIKKYKEKFSSLFESPSSDVILELKSDKAFKNLEDQFGKNLEIIENLKIVSNDNKTEFSPAFIEKMNIHLLYKRYKDTGSIIKISKDIQKQCNLYIQGNNDKDYKNILEKQKDNLMAQLYKENNKNNPLYFGMKNIIKISNHNPRHFINFMGFLYNYGNYHDENISQGFSVKIQNLALNKTFNWFENDYDKTGKYGDKQRIFSDKICRYLQAIRLSPKPNDTSIIKFYIDNEYYSIYEDQLKILCGNRILIQDKDRPGKQSNYLEQGKSFKVNLIYSKKYTLPISSRGTVKFNQTILKAIFDSNEIQYNKFITGEKNEWKKTNKDNGQASIF